MSEFISICPKCRHQILCDTAYVGKRIACPVCLQEISMPEPPGQIAANPAMSAPSAAAASTGGKRNLPVVVIGSAVLVLAGVVAVLILHKSPGTAAPTLAPAPTPTPAMAVPPTPAPAPAVTPAATPTPSTSTAAKPTTSDPCRAIWTFDQDSGSTVTDTTGNGNNATLVGDKAAWTRSAKVGSGALSLGGASYAETPGAVIDTSRSFTVTAWVNVAALDKQHNQTFVSIDGTEISGFYLMLYHSGPRFVFNRSDSDDKAATRTMATAASTAVTDAWYHLAGVYDADARTLSLYVNGNLEETVTYDKAWQATGKTAIGRGFYGHANVDFVNGTIDDVRLYSSALTADQIQALAK